MDKVILGDRIYDILTWAKGGIFKLGELTQLSHNAFDFIAIAINGSKDTEFKIQCPLGVGHDGSTLLGESVYKKDNYITHYQYLDKYQLPLNGIYQLVTITEIMLGDLICEILIEHPKKIGQKKTISLSSIFECSSLEDLHLTVVSSFINELSYKSPKDFAETASELFSFNMLEIPVYHKYIEIKATRDVFIHDRGVANLIYQNKAATHARVEPGIDLPMDIPYFLHSYEACLRFIEILIDKFHNVWQSPKYDEYRSDKK